MSTVNLILLLRNSRRQHKTPWLVRLVSRADGAFILLNQTLWWPICVFVNSALQVAYLAESYETYTQKEDLADSYFWRTLIWCGSPLPLQLGSSTDSTLAACPS